MIRRVFFHVRRGPADPDVVGLGVRLIVQVNDHTVQHVLVVLTFFVRAVVDTRVMPEDPEKACALPGAAFA